MTGDGRQRPHDPAWRALVGAFEQSIDEHAERTADAICGGIAAYKDNASAVRPDVVAHTRLNFLILARVLSEGRPVTPADLPHTRVHAARRFRRGIGLQDFLHGYWTGHRILWEAFDEAAEADPAARAALLDVHRAVVQFMEVASTTAAETYVEAQEALSAEGERLRRDVLEDLLAGRELTGGSKTSFAQAAGLGPQEGLIVLVAVATASLAEPDALRSAGMALARAIQVPAAPLVVVRHEELVIVGAMAQRQLEPAASSLAAAHRRLVHDGTELAVGVSTFHHGWGQVRAAYQEACSAVHRLGGQCGILALPQLSALDYLTRTSDATAHRLIPARVRTFVAEDIGAGGELISTVMAYAACDLNATAAAEQLFVHVNTVRYRLAVIADRCGQDPRTVTQLIELLVAIRLVQGTAGGPTGDAVRG